MSGRGLEPGIKQRQESVFLHWVGKCRGKFPPFITPAVLIFSPWWGQHHIAYTHTDVFKEEQKQVGTIMEKGELVHVEFTDHKSL
jgi:hypothetical protein